MIKCNRDMCLYNQDECCLRQDIVLTVKLKDDEEELVCESCQLIGGKNGI